MSQEEYRNEGRRPAQSRSGHGGRRVAPSHPEGERLSLIHISEPTRP